MDLLKYQSFPAVAVAVRACAESVVEAWLEIASDNVPTAGALTAEELRDHLALALNHIARTLESTEPTTLVELMNQAGDHGDVRFRQHYRLSDLLTEYSLIRPILIDYLTQALERPMEVNEIVAVNLAVDVTVKQGIQAFVNHQKQQLQATAESRAKYLSYLSHDLRGGLNGTLLMIEVLRRELQRHEQFTESLADLESMRRSIMETVGTMDRFLHAEKLRAGKVQPRIAPVSLKRLIGDLVAECSWTARAKGICIESNLQGDEKVNSDRELLHIMLHNLLHNAIKYSRAGTVKINVELPDDNRQTSRISISDQGPGIAADQLSAIFEPYARGETHGQQGTGLGLSIVKQVAGLLEARVGAESKLGNGSTFWIEIPQPPLPAAE
jgi:signal transduction histidine kinase